MALSSMPQGAILDVVTSGQIAWDGLQDRVDEPFKSLGAKCLVFGNGDDDLEVRRCACFFLSVIRHLPLHNKVLRVPQTRGHADEIAKVAHFSLRLHWNMCRTRRWSWLL